MANTTPSTPEPPKQEEFNEAQKKLRAIIAYITDFKNILAFKIFYDKIGGNKWIKVFKAFAEKFKASDFKTMFDGLYLKEYIKSKWAWLIIAGLVAATFSGVYFAYYYKSTPKAVVSAPVTTTTPTKPTIIDVKPSKPWWEKVFDNN